MGFEPELFAEIESYPSSVLKCLYPGVPNLGDVNLVDWNKYRDRFRVLAGGSPCQSFSRQGKNEGLANGRGQLTLKFAEIVRETQPELFIWENVSSVLGAKDNAFGKFLSRILGTASELCPGLSKSRWAGAGLLVGQDYALGWRIFDPREFGIPQRRSRVFVVGINIGKVRGLLSEESRLQSNWLECLLAQILFVSPGSDGDNPQGGAKSMQDSTRGIKCFKANRQIGRAGADSEPKPKPSTDRGCLNANRCWAFSHIGYGQDMASDLSPTLRALSESGNSNVSVFYQNSVRKLTPTEYLRLQGFPDDYLDYPLAPDLPKYKAIGNSICVPILAFILNQYLEGINEF